MGFLRRVAQAIGGQSAGRRIGKYRIIRRLAEGGMGEIFLARSEGRAGFEKVVVLKRILPQAMANDEAVRMFMDEARLMATFNHPNIVQVYDFGTAGGSHFFTMEYVHGEDLGRIMKTATLARRSLSLELAIATIAEAAAGLHYAHEMRGKDGASLQIVHRDISPSNVLVSYEGAVRLADFGIAKWAKRETETRYGALKGKVAYMSPEQCRAGALDRRSDVFGLGILLYELTTGSRLFQGTSDFAILEQIVNHDVPPPSTRAAGYPAPLERIVMKALARRPEHRFGTARDLQLSLEELAHEAHLKLSASGRAAEMEALFGNKVGAWREAIQAGRSLGEHLEEEADAGAVRERTSTGETRARTVTMPEGIGGATPVLAPLPGAKSSSRRAALAFGLTAAAAGAAWVIVRRPARRPAAAQAAAQAAAPQQTARAPGPEPTPPSPPPPPVEEPAPAAGAVARQTVPPSRQRPRAPGRKVRRRSVQTAASREAPSPKTTPKTKGPAGAKVWDPDSIYLP